MADVKISQLPSATTPLGGSEEIPLVQSSTTKKVTVGGLFTSPTLVTPNLGTPSAVNLTNATNVPMAQATGTLPIANGGTNATTAGTARTNLGAAASGANSDITSMTGVTGGISSPDFVQFDTGATVTDATGRLYYNNDNQFQTLQFQMNGAQVQHIGQEQYYRVKLSAPATKGQVMMFTGSVGASGGLTAAPATGLLPEQANYILGIAAETGTTNDWVFVTGFGEVKGINTTGGAEAWTQGQELYYNPSVTGGLTKTKPTTPNAIAFIAAVVHVGTSNGILFIRPTFGSVLGGTDGNVQFGSLSNGDVIVYDSGDQRWENRAQSTLSVGTATTATNVSGVVAIANGGTGQTTANAALNALLPSQTSNNGKVLTTNGTNTSWTTAATGTVTSVDVSGGTTGLTTSGGPVTSSGTITLAGTLAVANGGTGQTTYTDGQLLIGNTATGGLTKATLTAGTNVSIVNGNGTITIAATGGSGGGDVSGPASATNNAVVLFDGTTGKLIKDSTQTIASTNTASTVVARDGSGNFSAGTITAALSGNATTATTLQTARTINGTSFDGSANITITANTPNALTAGSYLTSGGTFDGSAARTFAVDATDANTASKVVARDASGNFSAGTITATGLSDSGNLAFTGTGNRITGDFSNATVANRVAFQTSTANTFTSVGIITNGTGNYSEVSVLNSSDPANASIGYLAANGSTDIRLVSTLRGTGTYLPMTFYTSGTEKLRIAADTTGTYTFGGTAPRITGDFSNTTLANRVMFQSTTAGGGTSVAAIPNATGDNSAFNVFANPDPTNTSFGQFRVGAGTGDVRLTSGISGTGTYLPMTFYTGGSERVRIDTSGNVGVGATPSAWAASNRFIDINASASYGAFGSTDSMMLANAYWNGSNWIRKNANNAWRMVMESTSGSPSWTFQYAGNSTAGSTISWSEAMRITSAGDVGIGTSSPSYKLEVASTNSIVASRGTGGYGSFYAIGSGTNASYLFLGNAGGEKGRITSIDDGTLTFGNGTSTTERARITSGGDFLVGTTTANGKITSASSGVGVAGYFSSSGSTNTLAVIDTGGNGANIKLTGDGATTPNKYIRVNGGTWQIINSAYSAAILQVADAGVYSTTVGATNRAMYVDDTNLIGYLSSVRASKTNITSMPSADWVWQLQPKTFNYRKKDADGNYTDETDGGVQYGLIAEEVEQVRPELCFYDEVDGQQQLRGVHYDKMIVPLLKAIQELKAEFDAYKATHP